MLNSRECADTDTYGFMRTAEECAETAEKLLNSIWSGWNSRECDKCADMNRKCRTAEIYWNSR